MRVPGRCAPAPPGRQVSGDLDNKHVPVMRTALTLVLDPGTSALLYLCTDTALLQMVSVLQLISLLAPVERL